MTMAVLTRALDEELRALFQGEDDECPACGEHMTNGLERLDCLSCGSALVWEERAPGQLSVAI